MIKPSGKPNARLMIVGEAPGESELEEGLPFVGASGRMLWTALERFCGIHRHECYVTNVVQEAPALKSGKPSTAQVRKHWERLDKELAASGADTMLLVGGVSLTRVTGITKGITLMRGYVLRPSECRPVFQRRMVQVGEYKTSRAGKYAKGDPRFAARRVSAPPVLPPNVRFIIPTIHPAGVMRSGFANIPAFWADIQRVGRALNNTLDLIDRVPYATVNPWFVPGQNVAWDIETEGEDWYITRLGVSDGEATWTTRIDELTCDYVRRTLLDETATITCHNAGFDIPKLVKLVGLTVDDVRAKLKDTMLEAQLLCPDLPKGLEKVGSLYLDVTPWKDSSGEEPEAYNAKDAFVTARIRDRMDSLLEGQTAEYDAIITCMKALWKATRRGIRYDPAAMADWRAELVGETQRLIGTWPYPGVDMSSSPALVRFLYYELKLPKQYTKEGGLSADRGALAEIKLVKPEAAPLLDHITAYRKAAQELSTWAAKDFGERMHPNFLPALKEEDGDGGGQGAVTGRIQAREPNIENLPARRRNVIIADPGKKLWYVDWAQAEAWVEAVLFEDETLKVALAGDIHSFISEKHGIDRTRAKNFWYGNGRGAGPTTLRHVMVANGFTDVSTADCRAFQRSLADMFPQWARGRQKVTALAKAQRFIDNPFGRRRRWFMPGGPGLPDVVGWLIQGTVGSMFIRVIPEIDQHVEILTPYHDAVLFQSPDSPEGDAAARKVIDIMRRPWPEMGGFALNATAASGYRWSELEDYDG